MPIFKRRPTRHEELEALSMAELERLARRVFNERCLGGPARHLPDLAMVRNAIAERRERIRENGHAMSDDEAMAFLESLSDGQLREISETDDCVTCHLGSTGRPDSEEIDRLVSNPDWQALAWQVKHQRIESKGGRYTPSLLGI